MTENRNIIRRISGKLKSVFAPVYNMHQHRAEQYYFKHYYNCIEPYLNPGDKVCDIGCQFGRFTIPLADKGLKVTATDLKDKYFKYISRNASLPDSINFRKESIDQTISNLIREEFDAVLCIELLYNLPDTEVLLKGMKGILAQEGLLFASHRSLGYYIYRFLREGKISEAMAIVNHSHPGYNAQSPDELKVIYNNAGFEIIAMHGIGMFSGYAGDAFSEIFNPGNMKKPEQNMLYDLESDSHLQNYFINNSRYILVVAKPV